MSTWNDKQHPEWFAQYNVVDLSAYKAHKSKTLIKRVLGVFGDHPVGKITGTVLTLDVKGKDDDN